MSNSITLIIWTYPPWISHTLYCNCGQKLSQLSRIVQDFFYFKGKPHFLLFDTLKEITDQDIDQSYNEKNILVFEENDVPCHATNDCLNSDFASTQYFYQSNNSSLDSFNKIITCNAERIWASSISLSQSFPQKYIISSFLTNQNANPEKALARCNDHKCVFSENAAEDELTHILIPAIPNRDEILSEATRLYENDFNNTSIQSNSLLTQENCLLADKKEGTSTPSIEQLLKVSLIQMPLECQGIMIHKISNQTLEVMLDMKEKISYSAHVFNSSKPS